MNFGLQAISVSVAALVVHKDDLRYASVLADIYYRGTFWREWERRVYARYWDTCNLTVHALNVL
jgi:hypothetical protein